MYIHSMFTLLGQAAGALAPRGAGGALPFSYLRCPCYNQHVLNVAVLETSALFSSLAQST